jgi:hypothetical protein
MSAKPLNTSSLAVVAFALLAGTVNCAASDAALDSFERMLAHQPGRSAPVVSVHAEVDPLIEAMVVPLRDGIRRSPLHAADAVAGSFARMLAHTPGANLPPVPAGIGPDPLIAAVVEPLRQWQAESVAAARYAAAVSRTQR